MSRVTTFLIVSLGCALASLAGCSGEDTPAPVKSEGVGRGDHSTAGTGPMVVAPTVSGPTAKANEPATVDGMTVKVTGVADPVTAYKASYPPKAGTRYVNIGVELQNNGKTAEYVGVALCFRGYDKDGAKIDVSSLGAGQPDAFKEAIKPGAGAQGEVSFQVPEGKKLATVRYGCDAGVAAVINLG